MPFINQIPTRRCCRAKRFGVTVAGIVGAGSDNVPAGGTLPISTLERICPPFISQIPRSPAVLRQIKSASPLLFNWRCPTIVQLVGTLAGIELETIWVLFISQIPTSPAVSRQAMSLLPSPLKSWVSASFAVVFSETLVADAHADAAPPAVLSLNTIAGNDPGWAEEAGAKLRLFVSPVKPWPSQEGPLVLPLFTARPDDERRSAVEVGRG